MLFRSLGIPPSPNADRVGCSDHDRFRGYFAVHWCSGLQPPCLRFAVAVTGHHARLGSRLLARLYRGRHLRRQSSTHLHGATRTEPYVRLSRIRLVWGFLCQGCITPFLSCFVASFFARPAPRAFFRPDRIAVAHSDGHGRRFFSTVRVVYHAMIRGEPAIGHEQSRANHACIRLNPYRVPTMKQSYASACKAPRRRVHSPSGIAAIAVYGLPPPRIAMGIGAQCEAAIKANGLLPVSGC